MEWGTGSARRVRPLLRTDGSLVGAVAKLPWRQWRVKRPRDKGTPLDQDASPGRFCLREIDPAMAERTAVPGYQRSGFALTTTGSRWYLPGTDGDGSLYVAFGVPQADLHQWRKHLEGVGVETASKVRPEGGESLPLLRRVL